MVNLSCFYTVSINYMYKLYNPFPLLLSRVGLLWCTCKNHFQKLQNRAVRIITNISFDALGIPLVRRLDWKTIEELIAHELELMIFTSIHGQVPQYMRDLFTKISQLTSHNLHNIATDLWQPQKRFSTDLKYFSYRGTKTWNSSLTKCKQVIATNNFKSYLPTFLLLLSINFVYCTMVYS